MATRAVKSLSGPTLLCLLFLAAIPRLGAQETAPPPGEEESLEEALPDDNYYELDEEGNPVYTQVLKWTPVEHVLHYGLEIRDETEELVYQDTSKEPSQTVNLPPGEFQYRIILYNLLGKPELRSPWKNLSIKRAIIPRISNVSPGALYLENKKGKISVTGTDLLPEAQILLVDSALGIALYKGELLSNQENAELEVQLPVRRLDAGTFKVKIINPGGLYALSPQTLKIMYQKPIDLSFSAGWTPLIPLYDEWFTSVWDQPLYPLAGSFQADLVLLKRWFGYIGLSAALTGGQTTGGDETISFTTTLANMDLHFLYKYKLTPQIFLLGRLGPGINYTDISLSYGTTQGQGFQSLDTSLGFSLGGQYLFSQDIFLELGVGMTNILYKDQTAGFLAPFLRVGKIF